MTRLTITLADRTHRALKEAAVRQGRSMAAIIEESLEMRGIRPLDTAREIVASYSDAWKPRSGWERVPASARRALPLKRRSG